MSENTTTEVTTDVENTEVNESSLPNLTPFAACKVANKIITVKGFDKDLKPQMFYTYAKKGLIDSNYATRTDNEKIYFVGASFKTWLDKYITKLENGEDVSGKDYDELAEQFA